MNKKCIYCNETFQVGEPVVFTSEGLYMGVQLIVVGDTNMCMSHRSCWKDNLELGTGE